MKQNIGKKLALYPTPATVVGTVGEGGKVNWLLVAHIGIVSHSKLLLSVHSSHHSVKAIDEQDKLSINIIDETFLAVADYTGTVSGAKTDKSALFPYHLGEAGMPIIEQSPLVMECERLTASRTTSAPSSTPMSMKTNLTRMASPTTRS